MKNQIKRLPVLIALISVFALCFSGAVAAYADNGGYYVCFSNQNYQVKNANKMKLEGGEYILENISLSSAEDFYVTDNAGTRWYAKDDEPLSVEKSGIYAYDLKFSPTEIYSSEQDGWANTGCKITYRFHVPASCLVQVNGENKDLTFNPYHTAYDLYYISSIKLNQGDKVSYGGKDYTVQADGYYRILFTPDKTLYGNTYRFDKDGNYGSGDDYVYNFYVEDAPAYFAVFKDGVKLKDGTQPQAEINGKPAYIMERFEENVGAAEYRTPQFFVGEKDTDIKYYVYCEEVLGGTYKLIDDDNDKDTEFSKLKATDAGWYTLSFTNGGTAYISVLSEEDRPFDGWYAVGEFNNFGYDKEGEVDVDDKFKFVEVEDGDDDYDEDYTQYILYLTVFERDLRSGDLEFYITDGKTKYKNGSDYIALNQAGKYKVLFSKEHYYGRRHYRYVLEDEDKENTELTVSTAQEFIKFAQNCSRSADYSVNLTVYLAKDIDFKGIEFTPVDTFSGKFLGQNHVLKNITYSDGTEYTAVFSVVTRTGSIERLEIENINLGGKDCDYVGVVGKNYGTVTGVTVTGTVYGRNYVGGIVAYNGRSVVDEDSATVDSNDIISKATIKNSFANVKVSGTQHIGGLCGYNSGEVISSKAEGQVDGVKNTSASTVINIGGVAGYSSGKIYDCVNKAKVSGGDDSLYAGGIAGLSTSEIYFSFNYANVTASKYVGGVCGYFGTVDNDSEDLKHYFKGMDYEEFIKYFFGKDTADQPDESAVGNNIINYCVNLGNVTASFYYAGGVLGNSATTATALKIKNCANSGDIKITTFGSYAGGIAGNFTGAEITGCVTYGLVQIGESSLGGSYAGGIAGYGGKIYYSMSASTVRGGDYVGGIAGYATSDIIGCYTNVLIDAKKESVNKGAIAGFSDSFNASLNSFGNEVKGNYYVGAINGVYGIHGKDYAKEFNYAAAEIDSAVLATSGIISPLLCEDFSREYWQGGKEENSYPVPFYFEKVDDCEEFDDEEEWQKLFTQNVDIFSAISNRASRLTYTVTFKEWNKDNGSLYEDGELQLDNFDSILTVRAFAGEIVEIPVLAYAKPNGNGLYVYEGDEARYFVTFPKTVTAEGNNTVYAEYVEIKTSLTDEENKIFVEGDFYANTKVELVRVGDYYTLRFTLDGKELTVENVTVKFLVGDNAGRYSVIIVSGENEGKAESKVSGKYVSFTYTGGQYFNVELNDGKTLPSWAWLLIGMAIAVAVAGIAIGAMIVIKKKKNVKAQGESAAAVEESVEENSTLQEGENSGESSNQ